MAASLEVAEAFVPPPRPALTRGATGLGAPEVLAQPKLLRGKTGIQDSDNEAIAALVVQALEWDVEAAMVKVKDCSGHGGSKSYKVSAPGVDPVAVHLRRGIDGNELSEERTAAASKILAEHHLAPQRLAEGGDWFIEEWEGLGNIGDPMTLNKPKPNGCKGTMVLVPAASENRLIFEHAATLRAPFPLGHEEEEDAGIESEEVALTLLSHPGKAVVLHGPPERHGRFEVVKMGLGPPAAALRVAFDGNYLTSDGRVFDIDSGKICEDQHLWWLKEVETRRHGGGRDFTVNEDGTVSPTNGKGGLVLGVREDDEEMIATVAEVGRLLAKLHQVPVHWFEPLRERLCALYPGLDEASHGSAVWWYSARKEWLGDLDAEGLRKWIQAFPEARSTAGKRLVTTHFDFHPGNILRTGKALGNQFLRVIDLEFCCVSAAANDIAYACCLWLKGAENRREFARAYLEGMGDPATEEDVDALLLDALTIQLCMIHGGIIWEKKQVLSSGGGRSIIEKFLALADDAQSDAELREDIIGHGLEGCAPGRQLKAEARRDMLSDSPWYKKLAALDAEPPENLAALDAELPESRNIEIRVALDDLGDLLSEVHVGVYKVYQGEDRTEEKATQSMVQLVDGTLFYENDSFKVVDSAAKIFTAHGLTGTVKTGGEIVWNIGYTSVPDGGFIPAKKVEAAPLALQVRAGTSLCELGSIDGSVNQRWRQDGEALQHVGTGLWLDSEAKYCLQRSLGSPWESCGTELRVRPKAPGSDRQRWFLDGMQSGRSDRPLIRHVIDGRVLDVNFGVREVGQGVHVNLAHRMTSGQTWEVHGEVAAVPEAPTAPPTAPIVPNVDGAEFLIQPAANKELCLAVRADGYTKDPFEVYLASVKSDTTAQRWRLVRNCTFQHVESGRFLHSEIKYAFVHKVGEPWEDNHTDLVTRPEDFSDAQRWVVGPEEFHGGHVLRHFKDGRGVDIHGWSLKPDNNVGCENSVNSDCRGVSYVFTLV